MINIIDWVKTSKRLSFTIQLQFKWFYLCSLWYNRHQDWILKSFNNRFLYDFFFEKYKIRASAIPMALFFRNFSRPKLLGIGSILLRNGWLQFLKKKWTKLTDENQLPQVFQRWYYSSLPWSITTNQFRTSQDFALLTKATVQ